MCSPREQPSQTTLLPARSSVRIRGRARKTNLRFAETEHVLVVQPSMFLMSGKRAFDGHSSTMLPREKKMNTFCEVSKESIE